MSARSLIPVLLAPLLSAAAGTASADDGGYLFVTFRGERTARSEQVYFATSRDGRSWEALHDGEPVLVSELGEQGVRDPFILRSHDGKKAYLIATDLSINRNGDWTRAQRAGSKSILVWESHDLARWSAPRLVKVAADDAGCTWAPEAVYDEEAGDYLVFWASRNARDGFAKQRIWAARTPDFVTFGDPFIYIDAESDIIDTDIVRENGKYYRFSKDEKSKGITMEAADRLSGPWADVPGFSLADLRGVEGPACYLLAPPAASGGPATWCLLLDHYARGAGYRPYVTRNLSTGRFEEAPDFKFPFPFRHGTVLPVTREELARLQAAY